MDVPDLAELREKAEKATPGPWLQDDLDGCRLIADDAAREDATAFVAESWIIEDAEYIAAVSPDVVLAILSLVDRLQEYIRVVEALQEADADTMGTLVREYNAARADLGLAGSPAANEGKEGGA